MKCAQHTDREAVGQCTECGAGLCEDCYNVTVGHICRDCVARNYQTVKTELIKSLISGAVGMVLFLVIALVAILPALGKTAASAILIFYLVVGGFTCGYSLFWDRKNRKSLGGILLWALRAFILAPIYLVIFIIGMVRTIKLLKGLKASLQNWPV